MKTLAAFLTRETSEWLDYLDFEALDEANKPKIDFERKGLHSVMYQHTAHIGDHQVDVYFDKDDENNYDASFSVNRTISRADAGGRSSSISPEEKMKIGRHVNHAVHSFIEKHKPNRIHMYGADDDIDVQRKKNQKYALFAQSLAKKYGGVARVDRNQSWWEAPKKLQEWEVVGAHPQQELPLGIGTSQKPAKVRQSLKDRQSIYTRSYHQRQKDDYVPNHESFIEHTKNIGGAARSVMYHYKSHSYELNGALRRNKGELKHPALRNHDEHLSRATSHQLKEPMTVYRGVDAKFAHISKMKPGAIFKDHGYISTSMDERMALHFSSSTVRRNKPTPRYVFALHLPEGTKAHHFDIAGTAGHMPETGYESEQEVVVHRGTSFRVTHHERDHDANIHYIHAIVHEQRKP